MKPCHRCGDAMAVSKILTGTIFKNGCVEVWVHILAGSALCVDQLEMNLETGELVDAR